MNMQTGNLNTAGPITAYAPVYAGFFQRVLAFIIDSVLLSVVFSFLTPLATGGITFQSVDRGETDWLMWVMLVLVCLYSALMESSPLQATLGKLVLGIRVTGADGKRLSFANALARAGLKIVSVMLVFTGCIIAAFTKKRQALHDFPTGSLVVRKGATRENHGAFSAGNEQLRPQSHRQYGENPAVRTQPPHNSRAIIGEWSTGGALIKADFENAPAIIASAFHETLSEVMAKAGLPLHNADSGDRIQVSGNFVVIDQGSRTLRYFTNGILGKARVEVEGGLMINGARAASLHADVKKGFVIAALGGDNQKTLTMCAMDCGQRVANQAAAALAPSRERSPV